MAVVLEGFTVSFPDYTQVVKLHWLPDDFCIVLIWGPKLFYRLIQPNLGSFKRVFPLASVSDLFWTWQPPLPLFPGFFASPLRQNFEPLALELNWRLCWVSQSDASTVGAGHLMQGNSSLKSFGLGSPSVKPLLYNPGQAQLRPCIPCEALPR